MLLGNKAVVCALSASYVSTFAGYPVRLFYLAVEGSLNSHLVGFYQIEVADNKNTDNDSETCRACVQRRGHYGILSRIVDTPNHDFLCS